MDDKAESLFSRRAACVSIVATVPIAVGSGFLSACSGRDVPDRSAMGRLGAKDVVDHIRKGEMTAEDYVLSRLEAMAAHRDLNAVITLSQERVLEAARALDKARARGEALGPAAGLPLAVKDQIAVAGYPATGGNGALKAYVPTRSAPVVEVLQRAGAIVFAKTNMPDMVAGFSLGSGMASENPYFGSPRNPYDRARLTGGTSGGNGALIGAGVVPVGIGEDTTGSIRFPASFCGIAGLRPSIFTIANELQGTRAVSDLIESDRPL